MATLEIELDDDGYKRLRAVFDDDDAALNAFVVAALDDELASRERYRATAIVAEALRRDDTKADAARILTDLTERVSASQAAELPPVLSEEAQAAQDEALGLADASLEANIKAAGGKR